MRILEFMDKFSDEQSCKEYFRYVRMKEGVICKKCGCKNHYWLKAKWQFQCSRCCFRTTLRSGTVMENSRLPFRTWFLVMLFMTSTKEGMSASELQRQLGHKRYMTIWSIMHRLRGVMGKRDDLYQLTDMVEFDEGYFEKQVPEQTREKLKRGRGSQRQINVAVMAESTPLENIESGKLSSHCKFFKMKVLESHKASEVESLIKGSLDPNTVVLSDKSTSYFKFEDYVEAHITTKSNKKTTVEILKWVHIAISNAKRNFLGIHHRINGEYMQSYLDEFVYKLNRRHFKSIFERLVVASVYPYWQTTE
ncbi:IS1595 family transposase [Antarcticibacterium flavum]|uniref:IS1595 family transposase n=1 Tax=Antarcticibacterium flavum TaxID=2058175 RepID=A0A5B7X078_9FLAO|nr:MULTISPECIES: IS1595 family transposase [Antarcticibacterium]MCM4158785.1 IS1595 family transposase [Antarcticibacterium sp. W02-3]QCY68635.1 IS1595 family transposase [Antarcticibacterium flavum]